MKTHLFDYIDFNMKLSTILILGILTAVKQFVDEYIFSDLKFLIGISLLIGLDGFAGSVKAWVRNEFDLVLLFKKTIIKTCSYVFFIGGVSILLKLKVGGHSAEWLQWIDDYLFFGVGLCEFWSITKNVNAISPGLVPKWMMKLFKEGAETGRITKPL